MAILHWKQGLLCEKNISPYGTAYSNELFFLTGHTCTCWIKNDDYKGWLKTYFWCLHNSMLGKNTLREELILSRTMNFRLPNWKKLQLTISNLIDMEESSSNRYKTLWEKQKSLNTSNLSFSQSVFKRLVLQTCTNQGLFGKGLKFDTKNET